MTNVKETPNNAAAESIPPPKPVEKEASPAPAPAPVPRSNRSSSRSKSATSTTNDQAQSVSPIDGAGGANVPTALTNGNGNGNGSASNGKRNSKPRWVPLEIDLSKSRSKRDRTPRNKRRDAEYEDDYSSERPARSVRRYRTTSYRGGRNSAIGGSRGGRRTVNAKSSSTRSRNDTDYLDYPSEYTLVNKVGADAPPFMMPYLGTFYYNGVPGFAKMDTLSIKDAIKKQM